MRPVRNCWIVFAVSGLMIGASAALAQSTSAEFVTLDTETQGNWKGVYGKEGYHIVNDRVSYPGYAVVTDAEHSSWTWADSTNDARALKRGVPGSDRLAACWFATSPYTIDIDLTDGHAHQVAVYFLDWDRAARETSATVQDAETGEVLDTQDITEYAEGKYLVWNVKGHVVISIIHVASANSTISGFFFDKAANTGASEEPFPDDNADNVACDVLLSWTPGKFAAKHDVYFGTVFEDVYNADIDNPMDVLVSPGQDANTFDPGQLLEFGQTYYWRVDEVNAAPDATVYRGAVWSFTVEPFSLAIEDVTATASSAEGDMIPENTINGSGLNELDQHSTFDGAMWLSGVGDESPWIQYEFDKLYKLDKMLVWNSNQSIEYIVGFGAKEVAIETSLDGAEWTPLANVPQFEQAPAAPTHANTAVDFGGVVAKYVRLNILSGHGPLGNVGLSEVRFCTVPVYARYPQPTDGDAVHHVDAELNWRAGREAMSHDVYLGTDADELAFVSTTTSAALTIETLNYDTTYYWSVTEVNDAADPASYVGDTWSFSTPVYGVVDDFESYDDECHCIFYAWQDGLGYDGSEECGVSPYGGNGTGAIVGNTFAPFAEQAIVHAGIQSLPLTYDSGVSEATLSFAAQDWTAHDVKSLRLYVHGLEGNTGDLYIKINDTEIGTMTTPQRASWIPWHIDLTPVSSSLLQNSTSLTVGVKNATTLGTVYVDDIQLTTTVPECPLETTPIALENASFEMPGAEERHLFNDAGVPGWSIDEPVLDSGARLDWSNTDGEYGAFLANGDAGIWQPTHQTIAAGDIFVLSVDARSPQQGTQLRMTLYYEANGNRIPAATREVTLEYNAQEVTLVFRAEDVPEASGKILGLELTNITAGTTTHWVGLDYVTLAVQR